MQVQTHHFYSPSRVLAVERTSTGLAALLDGARLRLDVVAGDIVRLKITHGRDFSADATIAVDRDVVDRRIGFEMNETADHVSLETGAITVKIGKSPFRVDAYRPDGSVILESPSDRGVNTAYSYLNDEFMVSRTIGHEDVVLGLGEKTGRLNRKGQSYAMWNTDVLSPDATSEFIADLDPTDPRSDPKSVEFDPYYVSIPFFLRLAHETGKAAGFFIDNSTRGEFEFQHSGWYRYRFAGGDCTEYIFAGPSVRDIIGQYTALTGRMRVPPVWALGYHQCRWFAYTEKSLTDVANKFVESGMPCDSLWLDIDHMDGYRVFTWNKAAFPNPRRLISRLKDQGFNIVTIVDPGVKCEPGFGVFDDGVARQAFCLTEEGRIYTGQAWPGRTAFPDFTDEQVRRWWGGLNAKLIELGVAGIWNDMNEPATGEISSEAMRFDHGRVPHGRRHNEYATLMAMATRDGLVGADPTKRPFILSRAGSAGIQRYAANWMGDNMSRWEHLWLSIPMALGLGISGQPFVGADIGGFAEDSAPELFARWMQCGALTPFCRNHNHHGRNDQYPWSFGKAVEDICRASLQLRYRLMPALYSTFVIAAETGLPIQRALAIEFQDDPAAWEVDDQFLVGDWLMVAPVTEAGCSARHVYLPKGTWIDWHTDEVSIGPKLVTAPTPMDRIPIHARGGAIVPMWPEAPRSAAGYYPSTIALHVFVPVENGEFHSLLVEDDGVTTAREDGAYVRTELLLRRTGGYLAIEGRTSGKGFAQFRRTEFAIVFHGASPKQAMSNSRGMSPDESGVYRLKNKGESFRFEAAIETVAGPA